MSECRQNEISIKDKFSVMKMMLVCLMDGV